MIPTTLSGWLLTAFFAVFVGFFLALGIVVCNRLFGQPQNV